MTVRSGSGLTNPADVRTQISTNPVAQTIRMTGVPSRTLAHWPRRRSGRWLLAIASISLVLILYLSSNVNLASPISVGGPSARPLSGPVGPNVGNATSFPYLINVSMYPKAEVVLGDSIDNYTLPQIAPVEQFSLGYGMVYVTKNYTENNTFDFVASSYNPTVGGEIYNNTSCSSSCAPHLPLAWDAPVQLLNYGTNPVTGDAIASANGSAVAVAASSTNGTTVFFSSDEGAPYTWVSLTKSNPAAGGEPRLAVKSCSPEGYSGIILTTISSGTLEVHNYYASCLSAAAPGHCETGCGEEPGDVRSLTTEVRHG
jgi:hypothetical protein